MSKLSSSAKHFLAQREAQNEGAPASVSILLRGMGDFSQDQITALEEDGAHIRTVAGDVLSADVPRDSLGRLEAHEFVTSIEISAPLYREAGGGSTSLADAE